MKTLTNQKYTRGKKESAQVNAEITFFFSPSLMDLLTNWMDSSSVHTPTLRQVRRDVARRFVPTPAQRLMYAAS